MSIATVAFTCVLTIVSLGFSASPAINPDKVSSISVTPQTAVVQTEKGFTKFAENEKFELYADKFSGEFYIINKTDNSIWYSNPPNAADDKNTRGVFKMELQSLMKINYFNLDRTNISKSNSEASSVKKGGVTVEPVNNGFIAVYNFPAEGFTIPIEILLNDSCIKAIIDTKNIKENKKDLYLISSIHFLPYFGAGGLNDSGYIFMPDGCGSIMNFNNGKQKNDEFDKPIYGRNLSSNLLITPAESQNVLMPVYGIKNGNSAFLSVVSKGDAYGVLHALPNLKNTSYANAYCEFKLRENDSFILGEDTASPQTVKLFQKNNIDIDSCELSIYPLTGNDVNYYGMARCYRQYLQTNKGLKKVWDGKNEIFIDAYCAVKRTEPVFGIPFDVTKVLSTVNQIQSLTDKLIKVGISGINMRLMSWSDDNLSGKIDCGLNPVDTVGSIVQMIDLKNKLESAGGGLFPNIDIQMFKNSGNGFSTFFDPSKSLSNAPAFQYKFIESTRLRDTNSDRYLLLNPNSVITAAEKISDNLTNKGLDAVSSSNLGSTMYTDFGNKVYTRYSSENSFIDAIKIIKQKNRKLVLEYPHAYAIPYANAIVDLPVCSSGYDVMDEDVPFAQIVLSGLVPYSVNSINLSSNPTQLFLKEIETGSMLHYSYITGDRTNLIDSSLNYLYSPDYNFWFSNMTENFKKSSDLVAATAGSSIYEHKKLADGVFETDYENGIGIIVNYNNAQWEQSGLKVSPCDFLITKVGANK